MRARVAIASLAALFASCGGSSPPEPKPLIERGVAARPTPFAQKPVGEEQVVSDLANLRFDKLGHPVVRWDAIPAVRAPKEQPHRLLVVLVEFADLGFERYRGDKKQSDKLASWYQEQLFDDTYQRRNTLSHYYAEQSGGAYHLTGKVLPPIRLPKARAAYGSAHRPAGGTWRNDADPDTMVEDALKLVANRHGDLPWDQYDRWDPADFDKDGVTDEPDGYLDHFVLVFAGGGQSSCQLLNGIGDVLTPNVGNEALAKLDKRQRECADRMWPHRDALRRREGTGPTIAGTVHPRGGVPLASSIWAYDYNMQSEYTASATFIHEFGHSIGLPDVYSRTSSNSTGPWEVMSSTADPSPQALSAWSRIQLGWLKPEIIKPPRFGGQSAGSVHLGLAADDKSKGAEAAMVILPPKRRVIELTELPKESGKQALYSGQGNEMNRAATIALDLSQAKSASIDLDAWWDIEGGWDFAYVEGSPDGGKTWTRLTPVNPKHMPAKHGHDGKNTKPGFTGISGDLDGDGKNESRADCNPKEEIKHGEDAVGEARPPCLMPSWVRVSFTLAPLIGSADARFRVRYYTDAAAVQRGLLVDNVLVVMNGTAVRAWSFEEDTSGWELNGFSLSGGRHELLVPHYYVLEYRDPYAGIGYDQTLASPSYGVYYNPEKRRRYVVASRPRPGVVAWYFDGAFAWSENDPAINGKGKGYLLALDANPNEIPLPGWEKYLKGSNEAFDTHYELEGETAAADLRHSYAYTVCFARDKNYLPRGGVGTKNGKCGPGPKTPLLEKLKIAGKKAMYGYKVINSFLPGQRDGFQKVSELVDVKRSKKGTSYRLRDRSLRYLHTLDAPFASEPFERGRVIYEVFKGKLKEVAAQAYPAVSSFDDSTEGRWQNPKLPFGGAVVPRAGFGFSVAKPAADAPTGARAKVEFRWK